MPICFAICAWGMGSSSVEFIFTIYVIESGTWVQNNHYLQYESYMVVGCRLGPAISAVTLNSIAKHVGTKNTFSTIYSRRRWGERREHISKGNSCPDGRRSGCGGSPRSGQGVLNVWEGVAVWPYLLDWTFGAGAGEGQDGGVWCARAPGAGGLARLRRRAEVDRSCLLRSCCANRASK
jgi:hypothetical protein